MLGIENHGGAITGSPETLKRLFDQIGSPYLGLLYDPCNYVQKNVDYRAALELLKDHLAHVHLITLSATLQCKRLPEYFQKSYWRGTLAGEGGSVLINQGYHVLDVMI